MYNCLDFFGNIFCFCWVFIFIVIWSFFGVRIFLLGFLFSYFNFLSKFFLRYCVGKKYVIIKEGYKVFI